MNKIDASDWKEFKVTNLLNWYHGRRRKRNDLDLIDFEIKPDLVGYLTAGFENQGAIGSCSPTMFSDETDAVFDRSITIDMFGNSFFHTYPCAGDDNVYFLTSDKYSDNQMLFLTGTINSITSSKFGYKDQFRQHNLETLTIKLPVTSTGEPDWDYMDEYIEKLATQAHTNVSSLAALKPVEHKINIKAWKEFKVGELFDIHATKKKFNAKSVYFDGKYPYVARGTASNGIRGYINEDEQFLNPANTISFGQDTATFYYQPKPYFTGDKIQIFELKDDYPKLNEKTAQFLITAMQVAFSMYSWGVQSFALAKLRNTTIKLPVTSTGQPDFDYMEKYIDNVQNEVHESLELLKQI